ncbi:MAG: biotin-dependent carboxyltransferase family protein [Firmicutes bacterium]|nr:biotin-dependent carboxyltransferase family protein [Bacillota bacterium]
MLPAVHVLNPGLFTTVQDLGRRGWQRFGVPVAGVFDPLVARVANWLVGNRDEAALLEITYAGPTLVTDIPLLVAITGGQIEATLAGEPVPLWQSFLWQPGQELIIGSLSHGARAYLAVQGGWQVPPVMGSRSTYGRAAIGGMEGRQLKAGDRLPVLADQPMGSMRRLPQAFWPLPSQEIVLRFVPGPQTDHFAADAVEQLCAHSYTVAQASDRMGIRLQGAAIEPLQPDIVSDAIALGSIQIPRDGQPIVMGPDRQTTGGYPKIGTVISVDVRKLAQARPGDKVRFEAVTIAAAQQIVAEQAANLQKLRQLVDKEIEGQEYRITVGQNVVYTFVEPE